MVFILPLFHYFVNLIFIHNMKFPSFLENINFSAENFDYCAYAVSVMPISMIYF